MGAEIFDTPLGWVVFALIFGAMPIYAALRTGEFFSHIDQHLSRRSDRVASGMAGDEQSPQIKNIARG
jgi:hypothetical protein